MKSLSCYLCEYDLLTWIVFGALIFLTMILPFAYAEKIVYSNKEIAKLIEEKGVLAINADTTVKDYPATLALKNIYNEPGVPVSILFLAGEKESIRWHDKLFADELKELLRKLPDR